MNGCATCQVIGTCPSESAFPGGLSQRRVFLLLQISSRTACLCAPTCRSALDFRSGSKTTASVLHSPKPTVAQPPATKLHSASYLGQGAEAACAARALWSKEATDFPVKWAI